VPTVRATGLQGKEKAIYSWLQSLLLHITNKHIVVLPKEDS